MPDRTIRIGLLSASFLPTVGGGEVAVHEIAVRLRRRGHDVSVIASTPAALARTAPYRVIRLRGRGPLSFVPAKPWMAAQIVRASLTGRFDVINAHFVGPTAAAAIAARRITNVPVVVTSHGGDIQAESRIGYGSALNLESLSIIRSVMERSDALTAISEDIRQRMIALGADAARIWHVANGTGLELMRGIDRAEARRSAGFDPTDMLILMVARNHPKKNFDHLLRAVRLLKDQGIHVRAVLVGRGTEAHGPLANELGIAERVSILGQIPASNAIASLDGLSFPNRELAGIYRACDVFVLPSTIEGFPLVIPEAMAAGLPVVCTDVEGNRDVVVDGHNGFLYPLGDIARLAAHLGAIAQDAALRHRLAAQALITAEQYGWDAIVDKYDDVFSAVVREPRKRISPVASSSTIGAAK